MARLIAIPFLALSLLGGEARAASWPFDQRNILLTKTAERDFPEDLTVAQILDIFVKRGRVRWVLQKGGRGQIVPVEVPGDFPWQSAPTVKSLGQRYKTDGIVHLQQKGTEISLRWYSTADGEPLFFEKVNLPAAAANNKAEEELRKKRLVDWLEDIWLRIPGKGYVVKRELTTVSFEGAAASGVKVGDQLEIRRLEQAQRHPLLKTLIGIESTVSGTATVTAIAEPFSTAKIDYESDSDPIQEGDRYEVKAAPKVVAASPAPVIAGATAAGGPKKDASGRVFVPLMGDEKDDKKEGEEEKKSEEKKDEPPAEPKVRLIDVTGRIGWSGMSHNESVSGASYEITGSGPSLDVTARAYLTREWVVDGVLGLRHYSPSNVDSVFNSSKIAADIFNMQVMGGYRFIFLDEPDFPGEFTISFGYRRQSFSVTKVDSPVAPVDKAFAGLNFGFSLRVPAWNKFGIFVGGARGMGTSVTESPITTGISTSSVLWNFEGGLAYKWSADALISAGIESSSATVDFEGAGQRATAATSDIISSTTYFAGYTHRF